MRSSIGSPVTNSRSIDDMRGRGGEEEEEEGSGTQGKKATCRGRLDDDWCIVLEKRRRVILRKEPDSVR